VIAQLVFSDRQHSRKTREPSGKPEAKRLKHVRSHRKGQKSDLLTDNNSEMLEELKCLALTHRMAAF
jgi:hypothetical protein